MQGAAYGVNIVKGDSYRIVPESLYSKLILPLGQMVTA